MKHYKMNIQKPLLQQKAGISPERRRVYWIMIIMIPFIVLGISELGLRTFHYGGTFPLFVSIPDESSPYYGINLEIAKRYFTKLSDVPTPRKDLFLKQKPGNGYRIFILGESSAAGFPYGNNITFSRILNRRLTDAFPERFIEVINTSLTAINTYTQLDFIDEILEQKPDAILIYTGHNEYYGALGVGSMESAGKYRWLVKTSLLLQKTRLYQLLRNIITYFKTNIFWNATNESSDDPSSTLMERIVKNKIIPFESDDYNKGINQFKENLSEIVQKAQDANVQVLLSELVSNIHDIEPFESINDRIHPSALKVYEEGKEYEKQGKFDDAKKAFIEAKDLDALRFRAPEAINKNIHLIADKYHVPVVPMKEYFESRSPHRLIGSELMHEHVHPNLDGYFLMANAFFESMRKECFIEKSWNAGNIKPSEYYRAHWGITALDSVYASSMILRLKSRWPFKKGPQPALSFEYFHPHTKIDSVVAYVLLGDKTLEMGHIEMANYFEASGDLTRAFNEYRALIYTVPYLDLFYEPAVRISVKMKAYPQAMQVLQELLNYQKTPFVYQSMGQVYLAMHEISKGIDFLEKARQMNPRNPVLLFNLGLAYYTIGQDEKGDEILEALKSISSDRSLIDDLKNYRKGLHKK